MSDDRQPHQRPKRIEIEAAIKRAGIPLEQVVFSVDEDDVDNAMIYPFGEPDEAYRKRVQELMSFAAHSGAAMGFSFERRESRVSTSAQRKSNFFKKLLGFEQ